MKVCACAAAGLVCVFLHQGGNFINFMFELLLHSLYLSLSFATLLTPHSLFCLFSHSLFLSYHKISLQYRFSVYNNIMCILDCAIEERKNNKWGDGRRRSSTFTLVCQTGVRNSFVLKSVMNWQLLLLHATEKCVYCMLQ